jgi:hypothetical protein
MAVASVALGGVAADKPKADDKTAVEKLRGSWRPESVTETLKWCFSTKDRPEGFESKEEEDFFLLVLRRQKPK